MNIKHNELIILIENLSKCFGGDERLFPLWFIDAMQHNFAVLYQEASDKKSEDPAAAINLDNIIFFEYEQIKNLTFTFKEAKIINYFIKEAK